MTVCGVVEARCSCLLDKGHDGPHECVCGGSWEHVDGRFRVVAWPSVPQPGSVGLLCPEAYAEIVAMLPALPKEG